MNFEDPYDKSRIAYSETNNFAVVGTNRSGEQVVIWAPEHQARMFVKIIRQFPDKYPKHLIQGIVKIKNKH